MSILAHIYRGIEKDMEIITKWIQRPDLEFVGGGVMTEGLG